MKRNFTIDRPIIASREIRSRQDFSKVVVPTRDASMNYKSGWFYTTLASVAILASTSSRIDWDTNNHESSSNDMQSRNIKHK